MSESRKPSHMSWRGFADQRIQEALERGEFENVAGTGQPIPGIEQPLDENWWVRKKLEEEQVSVVPPILAARKQRELVLAEIHSIQHESIVRQKLNELNEMICEAMASHIPGPVDGVLPVDIEATIDQWRVLKTEQRP